MEESKKSNHQLEINDLIDDAITNAVTRRGLVETLSDEEAASVGGGLTAEKNKKLAVNEPYAIAGFKPIYPYCPPTKPVEPACPPVKPICPPIIAGMIALPDEKILPSS